VFVVLRVPVRAVPVRRSGPVLLEAERLRPVPPALMVQTVPVIRSAPSWQQQRPVRLPSGLLLAGCLPMAWLRARRRQPGFRWKVFVWLAHR
jgi:hypothetical protein